MARKKRFKMTGAVWQVIGLGALAIVTLAVVAYALVPTPAPAAGPSLAPKPTLTAPPAPQKVAILGDSYTSGTGASQAHDSYTALLADKMGWDVQIFAQGGTGYTNPGQAKENEAVFGGRASAVAASTPDIVVVQGGTNDLDPEATRAAAGDLFTNLSTALPSAKIVAVGPVVVPSRDAETMKAVSLAVGAAAGEHGVTFIDPAGSGWLSGKDVFPDGVHPNDYGHKEYAELLAGALTQAGF